MGSTRDRDSGPLTPLYAGDVAAWSRHRWFPYAFAVLSAATAVALTYLIQAQFHRSIFVLSLAAVSIVGWASGFGPALLTTALCALGVDVFLIAPAGVLKIPEVGDVVALIVFSGVGFMVASLSHRARRSERSALAKAAQLTRTREFLEQAQSSAKLGSWEWEIARNQVTWSDEMFRMYGHEPGALDVSFETFLNQVHPDDREMVQARIREALETRAPFMFEHRLVRSDGIVRWSHSRGKLVLDAAGKPVRMMGSGQDITERRRASEAQRLLVDASEALAASLDYKATLETVAHLAVQSLADWCSVAVGDETGRHETIVVAHRDPARVQWAREYNRLNPPVVDAPTGVPNVLRTGHAEFYPNITREQLIAGSRSDEELRVIEELNIHSAIVVPMIARGRTIGAITLIAADSPRRFDQDDLQLAESLASRAAVAVDNARLFEEARQARVDAEAANRSKTDFLGTMSHELRTPLNAIGGYTELLEMEIHGPLTDAQREALKRVQRSQRNLLSLVDELLGYARIEAGQITLDVENVPLDGTLSRIGELVAPQMVAKKLLYKYVPCDATAFVRADEERLQQILLNLLTNATKFTAEGGFVTLTAECERETVTISVTDTGSGIPAEKLAVVFEPFVQLKQRDHIKAGGVGLGLAISRDLARAMDGDISVQSIVGTGSTFTVSLPRGAPKDAVSADESLLPPRASVSPPIVQ